MAMALRLFGSFICWASGVLTMMYFTYTPKAGSGNPDGGDSMRYLFAMLAAPLFLGGIYLVLLGGD